MNTRKLIAAAAVMSLPVAAGAAPVDLTTWSGAEGPGTWNIAGDNNSVVQTVNGDPTVFFNGENSQGKALSGTIEVLSSGGDDDFVGFVLGYKSGDLTGTGQDYILVDWKKADQGGFFGCVSGAGMAASHVTDMLIDDAGAWCHNPANGVEELDRAATTGSTGWVHNTEYTFEITFTSSLIEVSVDGVTQFSLTGTFADGSFGFYNYSQAQVRYGALQEDVLPPDPDPNAVPLPASLPLLVAGFGGLALLRRRSRV